MKKRLSCIIMVVLLLSSSVCAKASVATESPNAPSDLFIDLYSEVFSGTDSYEIYTREGLCVTDSFVLEHYEAYVNSDFQAIWNDVLENGYVLKYGEPEYVQNPTNARATVTMTARSEWVYVLEPLDDLVKNKKLEFLYRIVGTYESNGRKITSYDPPELELNMTYPGDLFPYTVTPTYSTTLNSGQTEITYSVSFVIVVSYAYSEMVHKQVGPYVATVSGSAL